MLLLQNFCKPVVFSFPDLFEGVLDDILPAGAGPYLLLSYLGRWYGGNYICRSVLMLPTFVL